MSSYIGSSARAIVAVLLATVAAVPASFAQVAASSGAMPAIRVKYSDLNLATAEGSRVLYERLVDAAEHVCPAGGYVTELRHNRDRQRCIEQAVAQASKQIRSAQFAQLAAARAR